ncbi:MAG: hypothetical protein GEV03_21630 [Streptosporangiales bacterium]|nr:hypothetical protein [Streptosporangiales bacterium]
MHEEIKVWQRAVTGELCWVAPDDRPMGIPVVPLVMDDHPCVALPYLHRDVAEALREAEEVAFAVTDSASLRTEGGAGGVAVIGPARVDDDVEGDLFARDLLEQELVKHPPSRLLADSRLLRRENWWWLPRVIVRLSRASRTLRLPARTDPRRDAVLVRDGVGLRIDTVRADDAGGWAADQLTLRSLAGEPLRGDGGPAMAFGHTYTVPDLERWEVWNRSGVLRGERLLVAGRVGSPDATLEPLGLLSRIRRQRDLARGCRAGIAEAAAKAGAGPATGRPRGED